MTFVRNKAVPLLGGLVCLSVALAGCGSGSSVVTTTVTQSSPTAGGIPGGGSGSLLPSSGSSAPPSAPSGPLAKQIAAARRKASKKITGFGSVATGAEKTAVLNAMQGFLRALASSDYAKVCDGLSAQAQASIARLARTFHQGQDCAAHLLSVGAVRASAAAEAAKGRITTVRMGGDKAYVIYRPPGTSALSYFELRREGGRWKAPGLETGFTLP